MPATTKVPAQIETPATATAERPALLQSTQDVFAAKYTGSANSINLPFGKWEFVLNAEGTDILIETIDCKPNADNSPKLDSNGKQRTFDVAHVTAAGMPDSTPRRVYTSAFTSPTGQKVLFQNGGQLKSGGTFGIYNVLKDGVSTTVVSTDTTAVAKGIAENNAASAKARADKEAAAAAIGG